MKTKLRLAVCQIRTETDKNATMEKAAAMIKDAADKGADIAVLRDKLTVTVKNVAGVVHFIPVLFRHRAADEDDAVFLCPA